MFIAAAIFLHCIDMSREERDVSVVFKVQVSLEFKYHLFVAKVARI
jgi:hypothetical protein